MAQLNSRGTLTRGRWDYFEQTNGVAFVYGSVPSGIIGCYFANNSSGALSLDLYNLTWFASIGAPWNVYLVPPPLTISPLTPLEASVYALQPDRAQLAGLVGMFTVLSPPVVHLQRISNMSTSGALTPVPGSFFLTLPPGWSIAVDGAVGSNPCELAMTVWYQEVTDNIAPAR